MRWDRSRWACRCRSPALKAVGAATQDETGVMVAEQERWCLRSCHCKSAVGAVVVCRNCSGGAEVGGGGEEKVPVFAVPHTPFTAASFR